MTICVKNELHLFFVLYCSKVSDLKCCEEQMETQFVSFYYTYASGGGKLNYESLFIFFLFLLFQPIQTKKVIEYQMIDLVLVYRCVHQNKEFIIQKQGRHLVSERSIYTYHDHELLADLHGVVQRVAAHLPHAHHSILNNVVTS